VLEEDGFSFSLVEGKLLVGRLVEWESEKESGDGREEMPRPWE
jgi:hypothetical protein